MIYGFSLHYKCFLDLQLTRYAALPRIREKDLQLAYPMPSSVQQQWGQHCVELWLFGCKKEGNFLALDFRSKIPYMFLQLHLILMPVNTQRHTDGCRMLLQLHSPWRKLQSVQVLPADSLLLHASALYPSHTHTQSNVPWMDGFPSFLSPNYKSATRGCKHLEMCRVICQLLGIITHH